MKIVLMLAWAITFAAFLISQRTIGTLSYALKSYQSVVVNLPIECRLASAEEFAK